MKQNKGSQKVMVRRKRGPAKEKKTTRVKENTDTRGASKRGTGWRRKKWGEKNKEKYRQREGEGGRTETGGFSGPRKKKGQGS